MPRVDLLTRAGKIRFEDAFPKRRIGIVDGVKIPYVDLQNLILSKETGRPFDEIEVRELKKFLKKRRLQR